MSIDFEQEKREELDGANDAKKLSDQVVKLQESEADYLGLIFSSLSGYDIRETPKIWERMKKANKGKEPPQFMSTHPSPDNRIKKINEWTNNIILDYPPINLS